MSFYRNCNATPVEETLLRENQQEQQQLLRVKLRFADLAGLVEDIKKNKTKQKQKQNKNKKKNRLFQQRQPLSDSSSSHLSTVSDSRLHLAREFESFVSTYL